MYRVSEEIVLRVYVSSSATRRDIRNVCCETVYRESRSAFFSEQILTVKQSSLIFLFLVDDRTWDYSFGRPRRNEGSGPLKKFIPSNS